MSERKDVDNQGISWDVDGIAISAIPTRVASGAPPTIEAWLAAQAGLAAKEGQG